MSQFEKENKATDINLKLIIRFAIGLAIICLLPVVFYCINFGDHPISDNPADWGTFGDYLGGTLNPILALIGLFITVALAYISDKRNQANLLNQERLVRPVASIIFGNYEDLIEVKIKNSGLGPMTIEKVEAIKNSQSKSALIGWMPDLPADDIEWTDFVGELTGYHLSPNQQLNLIKFEVNEDFWEEEKFRDELRETLADMQIKIEYSDIYGKKMPIEVRNLVWFSNKTGLQKTD